MQGPVVQPFSYDEAHPYAAGQHRGIDIGADAAGETRRRAGGGHGQLRRDRADERQVGHDRDRGRLLRHAHASRLDRSRQGRDGRRAGRRRHGRPERHARGGRAVRPPRDSRHGRSERLRRSARAPARRPRSDVADGDVTPASQPCSSRARRARASKPASRRAGRNRESASARPVRRAASAATARTPRTEAARRRSGDLDAAACLPQRDRASEPDELLPAARRRAGGSRADRSRRRPRVRPTVYVAQPRARAVQPAARARVQLAPPRCSRSALALAAGGRRAARRPDRDRSGSRLRAAPPEAAVSRAA